MEDNALVLSKATSVAITLQFDEMAAELTDNQPAYRTWMPSS